MTTSSRGLAMFTLVVLMLGALLCLASVSDVPSGVCADNRD
ncbi:hypothetical protein VIC_001366 [Vibrio coralliilyticus ATCC BAA-450]|nr:hypothetical protein VIC_001366 [Vibrio coralliilyticus ATCC BAA-450]